MPKEKVLVLRTIVQDTGADRGFLMAEGGYQSGALEAAREANVLLTSLADLRETASYDLGMAKLRALHIRNDRDRQRYWSMEKGHRIEFGLRPDGGAYGYSADQVMNGIDAALIAAFMYGFPTRHIPGRPSIVAITGYQGISQGGEGEVAGTPMELYGLLAAELAEVEDRLDAAEMAVRRDIR